MLSQKVKFSSFLQPSSLPFRSESHSWKSMNYDLCFCSCFWKAYHGGSMLRATIWHNREQCHPWRTGARGVLKLDTWVSELPRIFIYLFFAMLLNLSHCWGPVSLISLKIYLYSKKTWQQICTSRFNIELVSTSFLELFHLLHIITLIKLLRISHQLASF